MKFPLLWIKNFLKTDLPPSQLAEKLTMLGFEVESITGKDNHLIFDIAFTPNLSYAANIQKLSAELGAFLKEPVQQPRYEVQVEGSRTIAVTSEVPIYACRIIEGIEVAPSPEWLKERIEASGIDAVNNIVDALHYVMLEMGEPLHAFDLDQIQGSLSVRNAQKGEKILALNDREYSLSEEVCVIADEQKPLAVAGVIGSKQSSVTEKTRNVLLEAAFFEPQKVRRASKILDLSTDASYRFERGTDPNSLEYALDCATHLIQEIAGGIASPIKMVGEKFPPKKIYLRVSRTNQLLGTQLAVSEIETILRNLDLTLKIERGDVFEVLVPPYRHDLNEEIDLIEEVARFYGYHNIANLVPTLYRNNTVSHDEGYLFEKKVRELLLKEGLQEFVTCDLISPKDLDILSHKTSSLIHLTNPSSHEQSVLRPSLLPSLLNIVKHNRDHDLEDICGFEIGKLHLKVKDSYLEPHVLAIVLAGQRTYPHWSHKKGGMDYYDIKGVVENVLDHLHIEYHFERSYLPSFHPGRQASVIVDGNEVGVLGEVHPKYIAHVYFAEIHLEDLQEAAKFFPRMKPLPQFPSSIRDLTITVPETFQAQSLFLCVKKEKVEQLEEISLIDVYHSEKLGSGIKNMTFRFVYRDPTKTLSIEEIEKVHKKLTNKMTQELKLG